MSAGARYYAARAKHYAGTTTKSTTQVRQRSKTDLAETDDLQRKDSKQATTVSYSKGPLHHYDVEHYAIIPPTIVDGEIMVSYPQGWQPVSGRWLRDQCPCPECRNPDTGQKRINVLNLTPREYEVANVTVSREAENTFHIEFGDGHCSRLPFALFMNRRKHHVNDRHGLVPLTTWTAADVEHAPPCIPYADLQPSVSVHATSGMQVLLQKIREYGFAFVDDMPATPEATETLLQSIGPIRTTHYGGFYDFTSDLSSKDTAYTSEALEPHTDNTYFTEPAGLQALHLLSHTDGSGGESSLVDGFRAADQLYREDRFAYRTLTTVATFAHASGNDGVSIQPAQPFATFLHHARDQYLMQVRWNTADRAGIVTSHIHKDEWYEAAGKFDAILSDPKNQYWFQLKPGRMLSTFTSLLKICYGHANVLSL